MPRWTIRRLLIPWKINQRARAGPLFSTASQRNFVVQLFTSSRPRVNFVEMLSRGGVGSGLDNSPQEL